MLTTQKETIKPLRSETIMVTPARADEWLKANVKNRNPSPTRIAQYARDMTLGRWRLTGDPIRFDCAGRLIDGQHRLLACVEAGTPFMTVVIYDLPNDMQPVIDVGKPRASRDILALSGVPSSNSVNAVLRILIAYRDRVYGARSLRAITNTDILEAFERHPHVADSVREFSASAAVPRKAPRSAITFTHYVAKHIIGNTSDADHLVGLMRYGNPAYAGDPLHLFRERILRDGRPFGNPEQSNHTFYASWNAFVARRRQHIIQPAEGFIEISGLDRDLL